MVKLLIFAIPAFFIYLFVNEYLKQKRQAEENWNNQWAEKKKNFDKDMELKAKEREIQKLKEKLKEQSSKEIINNGNGFSSN